jgi:hypothetical protein
LIVWMRYFGNLLRIQNPDIHSNGVEENDLSVHIANGVDGKFEHPLNSISLAIGQHLGKRSAFCGPLNAISNFDLDQFRLTPPWSLPKIFSVGIGSM